MQKIEIWVDLAIDNAQFLQEKAEARHCTIGDLLEIAVGSFIERQQRKSAIAEDGSQRGD